MPQPVLTPLISSLRDLVGSFTESGSNSVNNAVSDSLLSLEQVHAAKDPNNKINLNMIHGCGARLWNAASGLVAADPEEVSKLMSLSLELLCFRLSFADTDEEKFRSEASPPPQKVDRKSPPKVLLAKGIVWTFPRACCTYVRHK